ncbi:MAG: hypothetical protein ACYTDV_12955, partial [Planctomycetota bacterium]
MRNWLLIVAAACLPAVSSSGSYSIRNPAARNPVGNSTVPASSIRSGLLTTPAPIDTAAELSITGNLRGGKHFRGNVPYRSTTDMGLDPATSSLNSFRTPPPLSSFLRDSAGPEDFGRRSSRYGTRPYYSPTDTVATTVPGQRRVFGPADTRVLGGTQGSRLPIGHLSALESLPTQQIAPGPSATTANSNLPPLRTRYDSPVTGSLSTSDGTFIGQMPPSLWDAGRLTPGEASVRRQDLTVAAQRLREHNLRFLREDRRESRLADGVTAIDDIEPRLEARTRARSVADARDRTVTHYRLSPLETSEPLVYPVLQPDTAGPKKSVGLQLPTAPPTPTLGARGSFMRSQVEETMAEPEPTLLPPGDLVPVVPDSSRTAPGAEEGDVMVQMRQRLNDLAESVERRLQTEPSRAGQTRSLMHAPETYELRSSTKPYVGGFSRPLRPYEPKGLEPGDGKEMLTTAARGALSGKVDYGKETSFEATQRPSLDASQKMTSLGLRSSALSPAEMSGQARRIMGTHNSRQSFSADKFNRHMQAAEDHLGAHRYYKAADSFALALVYRPSDPQALMGRSRALFAAGEY